VFSSYLAPDATHEEQKDERLSVLQTERSRRWFLFSSHCSFLQKITELWCLPPKSRAEFVCQMEEVRDVSTRPSDARYPHVCMDEMRKHRISETRVPLPMQPGQPACDDSEDKRQGTGHRCLANEPLTGTLVLQVTERRTTQELARVIRDLVDAHNPHAEKRVVVMENGNTHPPAALSEVFLPSEARRLARTRDVHSTPTHGRWLPMAEIELRVLSRPCGDRRIGTLAEREREGAAWRARRHAHEVGHLAFHHG
jgi:hypothetical protein